MYQLGAITLKFKKETILGKNRPANKQKKQNKTIQWCSQDINKYLNPES